MSLVATRALCETFDVALGGNNVLFLWKACVTRLQPQLVVVAVQCVARLGYLLVCAHVDRTVTPRRGVSAWKMINVRVCTPSVAR